MRIRTLGVALFVLAGCGGTPPATSPTATALPRATGTPDLGGASTPLQTLSSGRLGEPTPATTPSPTPLSSSSGTLPSFGHIYVVVMENHEYSQIIGNAQAPYINGLANAYGLATNYTAIRHPSEPNYLALWSGSTQAVTDDGIYNLTAPTLADQLDASGRAWGVAAQNVPLDCYTGATASGGPDGPGQYARKHEPAISFLNVSGDPQKCARITDLTHFRSNDGAFWLIIPNMCNDMHDCSVQTGDTWLKQFLPTILTSIDYLEGTGLVIITWDEGTSNTGGGGRVATIVISPRGQPASRSSTAHDHYSLLRTIQDAWGLPCLGRSCSANDFGEFFP